VKLETQETGNIGVYYACYQLSRMGWNVMPTARNSRGIDIIAYNKEGKDFIGVQVKTLSKRNPVPLGNSLDKIMGDF
jgi:Holliday junction resolvase-like predicted endonuclease